MYLSSNVRHCVLLLAPFVLMSACHALQKAPHPHSGRVPTASTDYSSTRTSGREALLRKNIAHYARKYKGVRYKYAGKDPRGFDCSGFTSYVLNKFDLQAGPSSRAQAAQGRRISTRHARAGDLIFFSKNGKGSPSHVALVVANRKDGLYVVHSTSSRGVVEENVSRSTYWKSRMLYARNIIDD